jgi:hypothetical protein
VDLGQVFGPAPLQKSDMSLQSPKFIISAISADEDIVRTIGGRLYYVGRDNAAEDEDKIPYIVVMPKGLSELTTKDDGALEDEDKIDVLVVAESGEALMTLAGKVRRTVYNYHVHTGGFEESGRFMVSQVSFSAGEVFFDPTKPCYYQFLSFTLNTED